MATLKYKNPETNEWTTISTSGNVGGGETLPIGSIMEYSSTEIPDNWLECDGSEISRTKYKELFDIIGVTYGEGDGSTTFNLPNKKGRVSVGRNVEDEDFNLLGKTGGEKEHQLTINEIPEMNVNMSKESWYDKGGLEGGGASNRLVVAGGAKGGNTTNIIGTVNGGNQPHNNLQPYTTTIYIIKYKNSSILNKSAEVIDNLGSFSITDALSSNQGRILNGKILDIQNENNYSTEEVNTGKKWIDGKEIYRKTYTIENPTGNPYVIDMQELDIDNIFFDFSHSHYVWPKEKRIIPLTVAGVNESSSADDDTVMQNAVGIFYNYASKLIHCEFGYKRKITKIVLTIEYTKTTD